MDAFAAIYRREVGRIYAVCLRMVADAQWAEVLTQDAFVRAWERLESFREESAFSTWLHRLAVNVVLNAQRTRQRRLARWQPTADWAAHDRPGPPPTPGTGLDLEACIAALPEQARMVLVLYDIEGYKHAEIADMMGIATGTSKAHLHRARALLRAMLQEEE